MITEDLMKIIEAEGLKGARISEDGVYSSDEVVILRKDGQWSVGVTDERGAFYERTIKEFQAENEACEYFLELLRRYNESLKRRKILEEKKNSPSKG